MTKKITLLMLVLIVGMMPFALSASYPVVLGSNEPDFSLHGRVVSSSTPLNPPKEKQKLDENPILWSEDDVCRFMKGCEENYECYPLGYIMEEKYCGDYKIHGFERRGFINQSESGEMCLYDYQCKSNFCFNGECVGSFKTLIKDVLLRIDSFEEELILTKENVKENLEEQEIIQEVEDLSLDTEVKKDRPNFLSSFKNFFG